VDRLINEVAAELGVSKTLVKNVYKHLFLSVHNTMKRGEYQNILLNGFGKFVVKPTRKNITFFPLGMKKYNPCVVS